jgi:hypothetical protein
MVCVVFYEWGFGVPSYLFLCLLLQFYSLELHHLTPLGIVHIAASVTLCRAQTWKWQCGVVLTSLSDPSQESIRTSIF